MIKANPQRSASTASGPAETPLARANRTKRPVLLALASLALAAWIGFLAYLAWRG